MRAGAERARVRLALGWAAVASLGLLSVLFEILRGRTPGAWSVGAGIAWVLVCAGVALLQRRTGRLASQFAARGLSERNASALARSWGRRQGIVALLVAALAAPVVFLVGTALPGALGAALGGAASIMPALLLFAAVTAWVELMGGSIDGEGPHCSRCGYPAPEGVGSTCPECGLRFSRPSELSEGRRSHPAWVKAVAVGAPAALLVVVFVMSTPARVGPLLPTAALIRMVDGGGVRWSSAAVNELSTRNLSAAQAEALHRAMNRSASPPPPPLAPGALSAP